MTSQLASFSIGLGRFKTPKSVAPISTVDDKAAIEQARAIVCAGELRRSGGPI